MHGYNLVPELLASVTSIVLGALNSVRGSLHLVTLAQLLFLGLLDYLLHYLGVVLLLHLLRFVLLRRALVSLACVFRARIAV